MSLYHLALWLICPAMVIGLTCFMFIILPKMYRDEDWYDPDDSVPSTLKEKLATYLVVLCGVCIFIGLVIWTVDSYQREYYLLTLLFVLSPIYIFWSGKKDLDDN